MAVITPVLHTLETSSVSKSNTLTFDILLVDDIPCVQITKNVNSSGTIVEGFDSHYYPIFVSDDTDVDGYDKATHNKRLSKYGPLPAFLKAIRQNIKVTRGLTAANF
jgi:hypothetical protein